MTDVDVVNIADVERTCVKHNHMCVVFDLDVDVRRSVKPVAVGVQSQPQHVRLRDDSPRQSDVCPGQRRPVVRDVAQHPVGSVGQRRGLRVGIGAAGRPLTQPDNGDDEQGGEDK